MKKMVRSIENKKLEKQWKLESNKARKSILSNSVSRLSLLKKTPKIMKTTKNPTLSTVAKILRDGAQKIYASFVVDLARIENWGCS